MKHTPGGHSFFAGFLRIVCGGLAVISWGQTSVQAQLPNAWQIADTTTSSGLLQYQTNLTVAQVTATSTNGWRYSVISRMISGSGGTAAQSMAFGDGTRRFYVYFDLDASGQLTGQLLGDSTYVLASAFSATNSYLRHDLTYSPVTSNVTYRVDGVTIATWSGQISAGQANQVMWGANASAGRGVMNYHHAEFEILGLGVIASYHAGYAGSPVTVPDPTSQGWTRFTSGVALAEAAVSPDSRPVGTFATTAAATEIKPTSARFNAQLRPDGLPGGYYFEYGPTVAYGSFTPTNLVSGATLMTNVSITMPGLTGGTTNHFRVILTNSFIVVTGANLSFTTPVYVITQPVFVLTLNTATLRATVNPHGLAASYYWEYGPTTNYGSFTATNTVAAGVPSANVSVTISNLAIATDYHYRAVVMNSVGTATGEDLSFTTASYYSLSFGRPSGSVAWGDSDNDGLLDVCLLGAEDHSVSFPLWQNTGAGFVNNLNVGLQAIYGFETAADWGDYDNDGRLDLVLAGISSPDQRLCEVWRNTGSGFTNSNAGLTGVGNGEVAWGDYDNDGHLDLVITGQTASDASVAEIWRNNGDGTFSNVTAVLAPGLPGVGYSSAAWGDYDNDTRLDLLITGLTQDGQRIAQVWRNTGAGFANIGAGLPGIDRGSAAWGDYDHDDRLDILLAGRNADNQPVTQVWRNTGSGFTNINAGLPGTVYSDVAWGDYDNDGLPDILITGGTFGQFEIWRNTGNSFTNLNLGFPGVTYSSCAFGDANNDGRLDILVTGGGADSRVELNLQPAVNAPPAAPSGLNATINSPVVSLAWNPGSDAETIPTGLTYNLRVGTSPGAADVVNPQASAAGVRRVAAMGNQQTGTNATLALPAGTYYWSVQTVDAAFAGSPFTSESSFTVPSLPLAFTLAASQLLSDTAVLNASVNPNSLPTRYHFEYGPTTNYGSLTATKSLPATDATLFVTELISGLSIGTTYHFRIVASNAVGVVTGADQFFSPPRFVNLGLPPLASASAAWGDYDRDGRLDLLLAGQTYAGDFVADVWRNTGAGFTNLNLSLGGGYGNNVAWTDYDNDGALDIFLAGFSPTGFGNLAFVELWQNTGITFTLVNEPFTPLASGALAWGDFDHDGRADLLDSGLPGAAGNPAAQIWRNLENGFTNLNAGLPGVWAGAAIWMDFDNDGRLDLLLSGATNYPPSAGVSQIWRNTGNGFTNVNAGPPGLSLSSAAWADFDGDGRLDLALAGTTNGLPSGAVADIWRNTASGFTNLNTGLPPAYQGTVAWGDYDNDGWPDLLLTGTTNGTAAGAISQVWRNTGSGFTNLDLGLPGVYQPQVNNGLGSGLASDGAAFGDYDNDGRLDIFLTGTSSDGSPHSAVWNNTVTPTNTPPTAPTSLAAAIENGQVQLQWQPASDVQTPAPSLSYNLRVGTMSGAGDVLGAEAEANGFRLKPALGNAQLRTNTSLILPPGTYYWSVQAVDAAWAGGSFAPEASFVVPPPSLSLVRSNAAAILSWQPAYGGWVLQQNGSLAPTGWTNSPSGSLNPVMVNATNGVMFYRLKNQ